MPWRGPSEPGEYPTLGLELVEWIGNYLQVPDGPHAGEPLWLTDEQADFLLRFYELDPETGRKVHRRGAIRRPKGWGKSPLLGAIAIAELLGPAVFDGWDANGDPVGRAWSSPWVQIAACSEDQTDNTYLAVYECLRNAPALDEFGVDLGVTKVNIPDRAGRLEPVTAAAGTREGQRVTFAVLDETHLWTPSNGGLRLAATLRRNAAKMDGATVETTNAFRPGEGSVAELTDDAARKRTAGVYYDSVEGPEVEDLSDLPVLKAALKVAYGDASWIDLDRIAAECNDPSVTPSDARRFYLNQVVPGDERFCSIQQWEAAQANHPIEPGSSIVVGFDGSDTNDSTVFYAWTVEEKPHGGIVRAWERPLSASEWQVPRHEVSEALDDLFDTFDVREVVCDPWGWGPEITAWVAKYGEDRIIQNPPNRPSRFGPACDAFLEMLKSGGFTQDGDPLVRRHVANAVSEVRAGYSVPIKEKPSLKIDALVAAILGLERAVWHWHHAPEDATWFGGWA